jgi:hypothetical protein
LDPKTLHRLAKISNIIFNIACGAGGGAAKGALSGAILGGPMGAGVGAAGKNNNDSLQWEEQQGSFKLQ